MAAVAGVEDDGAAGSEAAWRRRGGAGPGRFDAGHGGGGSPRGRGLKAEAEARPWSWLRGGGAR